MASLQFPGLLASFLGETLQPRLILSGAAILGGIALALTTPTRA